MGMGFNDPSSWALDIDPQFPTFNTDDLTFDATAFGLQNEQSSSTATDFGFNQHFLPTFNSSPNLSFDTPPAFELQQFSRPSSTLTNLVSTVAPAVINAPPSQFFGALPFMQFQPTPAPAPAFPHIDALLPTIAPPLVNASPSNASSPTVVPGNAPQPIPAAGNALSQPMATPVSPHRIPAASNAPSQPTATPGSPQHIPATSNASPQPTTAPVSFLSKSTQPAAAPASGDASSSPRTQNTVSSQHAAAIAQPVHTGANNGTTSSSDSPHSQLAGNPETPALSSVPATSVSESPSVSLNQAALDGRRSGRNPVPSKRHEQMNKIDGKGNNKSTASAHIEKENIPSTSPEWAIASHEHLLKSDLGEDWTACVLAWFELEQDLGYGSKAGAKVCYSLSFQDGTLD